MNKPSENAKAEVVRRTRGRNYSASLRLEGFSPVSTHTTTAASASYKQEVIAKYKQLAP